MSPVTAPPAAASFPPPAPAAGRLARVMRALRRCLDDRRGAIALVFAGTGALLVAAAALVTEGGLIYLARQDAQNSADAAATAAASAMAYRGRAAALAAATEVATRNGFTHGGTTQVVVNNPPSMGSYTADSTAFEVVIRRNLTMVLGQAFLGTSPQVTGRAVVHLQNGTSRACILALSGAFSLSNSSTYRSPNCVFASNSPGVASLNIGSSNGSVTALGALTAGTCTGCSAASMHLSAGYQEHAPPIGNPYAVLDSKVQPAFISSKCLNTTALNTSKSIAPSGVIRYYCAAVHISGAGTLSLPPGTYLFYNANLTIDDDTKVTCPGCTFVFFGASAGRLNINNASNMNMSAPAHNTDDADYNGVLFYRTPTGITGSNSNPTLTLNNISGLFLAGGIYFPQAFVQIDNVSATSNSNCMAIVAGSITVNNINSYTFDVSGCAAYGTPVPAAQVPQLVE